MIPLNDIKQLIDVYGKDIFANPRRVHAILSDWHPRQKVPFDEVQDTCQKWQKGQIKLPATDNPAMSNPSMGNPFAFANILEKAKNLIISHSKASANPVYRIIETAGDDNTTTQGNTTPVARKANTTTRKTTPKKPPKPTINTNPIDIKIDTSKSFRRGL